MGRLTKNTPHAKHKSTDGFTLVELSIVLVILGLLVGGVLAGQSLIRASELRAVGTEQSRYVTAAQAFRDKYFQLPGDMSNAASFWATATNGNGDGGLGYAVAEGASFWKHLQLAGLVEGNLSGTMDGSNVYTIGVNAPASKLSNAGWSALTLTGVSSAYNGSCEVYRMDYGNALGVGGNRPNYWTMNPVMKTEEAWNIDSKYDDSAPATGNVIGTNISCMLPDPSVPCGGIPSGTSSYILTSTATNCGLIFRRAF